MTAGSLQEMSFQDDARFAALMDERDPIRSFRDEFIFPSSPGPDSGKASLYFCGNSLGLQPKSARARVEEELETWGSLAVEGHFRSIHPGKSPWMKVQEPLLGPLSRVVGAMPFEIAVMNTLTVNLHLMMVSFYRPSRQRYKILVEAGAFPSDQYAVASQARFHGYDPREAIIELSPRKDLKGKSDLLRKEDILQVIEEKGEEIALVLLGNVNYLTGQAFDMKEITRAAQARGCVVGFDLAHGVGNLPLSLHDWNVDFAVWCSYKYLNGGPGALAGCFVHERHAHSKDLPRFAGWYGHNREKRFEMRPEFDPIAGAEGWQLSNAPILSMAPLRASLELFDRATMPALRRKSDFLTGYLEFLLERIGGYGFSIVTPRSPQERGAQLSLRVPDGKGILAKLAASGAVCDFREPDIIRVSPAPLYNSYQDVFRFVEIFETLVKS